MWRCVVVNDKSVKVPAYRGVARPRQNAPVHGQRKCPSRSFLQPIRECGECAVCAMKHIVVKADKNCICGNAGAATPHKTHSRFSQHLPPHHPAGRFECEQINFWLGCRSMRNKKQPFKLAALLTSRNTTLELQAHPYCYPLISLVSTTSYSASPDKWAQN